MIFAFWFAPMGIVALMPWLKHRNLKTLRIVLIDITQKAWCVVLPVCLLATTSCYCAGPRHNKTLL
jgi:hypothetical protein